MNQILEDLDTGETVQFGQWNITRVPGGWIFEHCLTQQMVFVPLPGL